MQWQPLKVRGKTKKNKKKPPTNYIFVVLMTNNII